MLWTEFWALIDAAVDDPSVVAKALEAMSEAELVEFYDTYRSRAALLDDERYRQHLAGTHSEDDLEDIAVWVVRQGYDYWNDVAYNPSKFPAALPDDDDGTSYPALVTDEYHERYGVDVREPGDPPPPTA